MPQESTVQIEAIQASVSGLILPIGLRIAHITFTSKSVSIVPNPFIVDLSEPAQIKAKITEKDLQDHLQKTAPGGLRDFEVLLADGKVAVTATAKVVFDVRATALCTLQIEDSVRLNVVLESVSVPMAYNIVQNQLTKLNPLFDASTPPLKGTITGAEIGEGEILLTMEVSPSTV